MTSTALLMHRIKHPLPITAPKIWVVAMLVALAVGILFDHVVDTRLDDVFHDAALVYHKRTQWHDTAIVALDYQVPGFVGRRQALGLFALASQRLLSMGASAVFLDARLYESTNNLYFAKCVSEYNQMGLPHQIKWDDTPNRTVFSGLSSQQFERFFMAVPSFAYQGNLQTSLLLQAYFGEQLVPADFLNEKSNTELLMRLFAEVTIEPRDDLWLPGLNRWMNISHDSVVHKLTEHHRTVLSIDSVRSENGIEHCGETRCKRTRFSAPVRTTNRGGSIPILPVSQFASCDAAHSLEPFRQYVQNRIIILQLSQPEEASDLLLTPMSNAIGAPGELLHGPQFLGDSIETHLQGDHPSRPDMIFRFLLFVFAAFVSVAAAAWLRASVAIIVPIISVCLTIGMGFLFPTMHLWPVLATGIVAFTGTFFMLLTHIAYGTEQGQLVARYLPPPVRSLLTNKKKKERLTNERHRAVVLMSDLRKYTTITTELQRPDFVFDLMNRYFEETTLTLQTKYCGWLEGYIGDMVVYYWPDVTDSTFDEQLRQSLLGAIELTRKQKQFFESLTNSDINPAIPQQTLDKIAEVIGAGVGITTGEIVMGNLGPKEGVQKFSCLGDPLNLASRVEALTRHFNTEIIITEELCELAQELALPTRKLLTAEVKGRPLPVTLYAMGEPGDERFSKENIENWQQWMAAIEAGELPKASIASYFQMIDKVTIDTWVEQGLLDVSRGVFVLTSK